MPAKKRDMIVAIAVTGTIVLGSVMPLLAAINIAQEMVARNQNTTMTRHINPLGLEPVAPHPKFLEDLIVSAFEALARGDIREVTKLVKILNETALPEKWRAVIEGVAADLAKLAKLVGNATILEKRIKTKAALNDIVEVLEACKEAKRLLTNLNVTYNTLVDKVKELAKLGVNVALLKDRLRKAVSLAQQLRQQIREILLEIEPMQHRLHSTKLWLNTIPSRVFYGENVTVKGCLASDHGLLPGRPIVLHYDNKTTTIYTSASGCFETTIKAVTEEDYITVYAEYVPQERDRLLYTYARSPIVHVKVLRTKPILLIYVYNSTVYPGENITIHIFSSIEKVKVIIKAFDVVRAIWLERTSTNYTLRVPPHIPMGVYNITAVVPRQRNVAEASTIDWVMVVRNSLNATARVPSLLLAGLDLPVTLYTDTATRVFVITPWCTHTAVLSSNKTHTIRVHIPITYMNTFAYVRIVLEPLDPRYEKYYAGYSMMVLNPLSLIMLSLAPSMVLISLLRQRQVGHVGKLAGSMKTFTREEQSKGETATYAGLLKRVEETVGVRILSSETLREYLVRVRGLLDENTYRIVERIVYVYEAIIYGGHQELVRELIAQIEELERVRRCSQQNG